MTSTHTVILGGGFGGARAALVARAGLDPPHRVTLIDRDETVHLCGMNPMLVVGERDAATTTRSLHLLTQHGIEFRQDEVRALDLDRREVVTATGAVPFDFLVVALGAVYDWEAVPGSGSAHSFYSYDRALRLRDDLPAMRHGRIVIGAARPPYKCPPAPFEMAMLVHWFFEQRGLRHAVDVAVVVPEPVPLGVAGPEASARVRAALEERRIGLRTGVTIEEVTEGRLALSDGSSVEADLIVIVPVHRCPDVVAESGLTNGRPWVPVDPATLETSVPGVFAIGDVNGIPIGDDKAIPKAGVFALAQGEAVARLIRSRVTGEEPPPPYDGSGRCFLLFSPDEAASVGGTFLAPGGPQVGLEEPSPTMIGPREQFEEDWRRFAV